MNNLNRLIPRFTIAGSLLAIGCVTFAQPATAPAKDETTAVAAFKVVTDADDACHGVLSGARIITNSKQQLAAGVLNAVEWNANELRQLHGMRDEVLNHGKQGAVSPELLNEIDANIRARQDAEYQKNLAGKNEIRIILHDDPPHGCTYATFLLPQSFNYSDAALATMSPQLFPDNPTNSVGNLIAHQDGTIEIQPLKVQTATTWQTIQRMIKDLSYGPDGMPR